MPGASGPRLSLLWAQDFKARYSHRITQREQPLQHSCHLQLLKWAFNGTHANESYVFSCLSILISPVKTGTLAKRREKLVELPGIAPGSSSVITRTIYRHSRRTDKDNIGMIDVNLK